MLFRAPIPPKDALASHEVKALFPTTLSSEEIMSLPAEFREGARFSAKMMNAAHVAEIHRVVGEIVNPRLGGRGSIEGMDIATARLALKDSLERIRYEAPPGKAGTIEDHGSDQRLNLILRTNVGMMRGYGHWKQSNTEGALDLFPCAELYRREERNEPRDWPAIWTAAGGVLYDGRMIAPKDSDIWVAISRFGLPYPPFDFNSGMWTRDVDYDTAVALGVIPPDYLPKPQERPLIDLRAAAPEDKGIRDALLKSLGPEYEVRNGMVVKGPDKPVRIQSTPAVPGVEGTMRAGRAGRKDLVFKLSEEDRRTGHMLVAADARKLNAAWEKSKEAIGEGKEESKGKRARIRLAIRDGDVTAPAVAVPSPNSEVVNLVRGRHTFAELRDSGLKAVPVSIRVEDAVMFTRRFGHEASVSPTGVRPMSAVERRREQIERQVLVTRLRRELAITRQRLAVSRMNSGTPDEALAARVAAIRRELNHLTGSET